jgi:hypothetical protein
MRGDKNHLKANTRELVSLNSNPMDMYNPYFSSIDAFVTLHDKAYDKDRGEKVLEYNGKPKLPKNMEVAMVYEPFQVKSDLYSSEKALERGTLFEVLDKPFKGGA